jgi:hypothetical protein
VVVLYVGVVTDDNLVEIRDLLVGVRDLLVPIADAYRPEYARRLAIRALLSTEKRKRAWDLATGKTTQGDIAKQAGMDRVRRAASSRTFETLVRSKKAQT